MKYAGVVFLLLAACGSVKARSDGGPEDSGGGGPDACVPESDPALCASLGNACEAHTATDNCGASRTVDCGACGSGQGCVVGQCQTPVCTTFTYTSTPLGAFSRANLEDSLESATPDGRAVVIYQTPTGGTCGGLHITIADEVVAGSGTYTTADLTPVLDGYGLFLGQEGHVITADGLTLVVRSRDLKQLVATTRSAIGMTDFGPPSATDFAAVNAMVASTSGILAYPVISADGLELVYTIQQNNDSPSLDGTYDAVRASTSEPFPAGTLMPPPVTSYPYATSLSSDRLTLFMFDNFTTRVLTRTSTSQPFTNPNAPGEPPQIPGWDHKPLADCSKLIATTSPGGCQGEDISLFTRQ